MIQVGLPFLPGGTRIGGGLRVAVRAAVAHAYTVDGMSIRAISEETGRSYGFVRKMLTEAEVSLRQRGGNNRVPADGHQKPLP